MKYLVQSALKQYNANRNQVHTTDCSIRALSLAYGLDYSDVLHQMQAISRVHETNGYRNVAAIRKFTEDHGYEDSYTYPADDRPTVSDFCEANPQGDFLLFVGDTSKSRQSHLVCVINGDVYDSWDCTQWYVYSCIAVKGDIEDIEDPDYVELSHRLYDHLQEYLDKQESKLDGYHFEMEHIKQINDYAFSYFVRCRVDVEKTFGVDYAESNKVKTLGESKIFVITFNPRFSEEENEKVYSEKLRVQVRDWLWYIKKIIKDYVKLSTMKKNPKFRGDLQGLLMLPDWAIPSILEMQVSDNPSQYKYSLIWEADKDDPHIKDRGDEVWCREDKIKMVIADLEAYRKDFSRQDYDF